MSEEKAISKSWIEKRIHEKAVKRWKDSINTAYNQLKDSVLGGLIIKNPPQNWCTPSPLNALNDYYTDTKEKTFSTIFADFDEYKKKSIEKFEQEETDRLIASINGVKRFCDDNHAPWPYEEQ